jgi:uncharacterized membrane protein YdjX (TVP38/TMEM64 family)
VLHIVATVLMVPGSPFTILSGALFGLLKGTLIVAVSSTAGAALAFLMARYGLRDRVERYLLTRPRAKAVDRAIQKKGWKIVALMRLSPLMPFNLQNYLYGVTAIRFVPFLISSGFFMLPSTFLYVYIGHLGIEGVHAIASPQSPRERIELILSVMGLMASAIVVIYLTLLARKAIAEAMKDNVR